MSVIRVLGNALKWVMITSGYKNESWCDENSKKNLCMQEDKNGLDHN